MEHAIGIAGLIIGILIPVIAFLRRKYILRPELTIEIIRGSSSSWSLGISRKNEVNKDGYIDGNTAIRIFELNWQFKVRITNNSDQIAYYPTLSFNPNGPKFLMNDKLNYLQPIKSADSIDLIVEYSKYEEKTGKERTDIGKELPDEFKNLQILLEYQNSNKSKFYTLFEFSGNSNFFLKRFPKVFEGN